MTSEIMHNKIKIMDNEIYLKLRAFVLIAYIVIILKVMW